MGLGLTKIPLSGIRNSLQDDLYNFFKKILYEFVCGNMVWI